MVVWRIHRTVNQRDCEKARIWLIHKLIDFPEGRGFVDSLWRTALLQPCNIYGEKKFMFDVDTKDENKLNDFGKLVTEGLIQTGALLLVNPYETPHGWHYITAPFDTREVCALPYVSLQRDGYFYIKTVGEIYGGEPK